MTDGRPPPRDRPPEKRYRITVELTAREIAALAGVAFAITSADDENHKVNYAEAAFKAFCAAVADHRP